MRDRTFLRFFSPLKSQTIMALCTACDQLARTLSAFSGSLIQNIQHLDATDLLKSAEKCRLCKFLISCIGTVVYSSTDPEADLTVMERLTLYPDFRGRLEYTIGFAPYQCRFLIKLETNDGESSFEFTVCFWAKNGMPYLLI